MRQHCLCCVKKHIGKAIILFCEAANGYPLHKWLALANLSEAEDECVSKYPALAHRIRAARLEIEKEEFTGDLMEIIKEVLMLELEDE